MNTPINKEKAAQGAATLDNIAAQVHAIIADLSEQLPYLEQNEQDRDLMERLRLTMAASYDASRALRRRAGLCKS